MINLDPKDQNKVLAAGDWHKKDIGIDPADPAVVTVDPAKFSTSDSIPTNPIRPTEPVTPGDTVDPVPVAVHNPSPETPGDLLSAPNDDNETNSSLSPVPSHPGPPSDGAQPDLVVDQPTSIPTDPLPADTAASRQSTPLTELSGPATPSRVKPHDPTPEAGGNEGIRMVEQAEAKKGDQEGDDADGKSDAVEDITVVAAEPTEEKVGEEKRRDPQAQTGALDKGATPAGTGSSQPPSASPPAPAKAPPSASSSRVIPNGVVSDVAQPADTSSSQPPHKGTSRPQKSPPALPAADEKATVILQLNAELLKVCIECQTRQMMQSSEFNSYASRLQSNLTWLAAAADRDRHATIPLPIMSPPAAVSFFSPQAINDFYQRLPHLFAKEIATRQKEAAQTNSAGVKRGSDTADDAIGMRKRLDTGERRLSNPTSSSSPPHARSPSVMSNGTVGSAAGMNLGMNVGMNIGVDPHGQPAQGIGMGTMVPQQASQQQPALRVSPESVQPSNQQLPFAQGAMSEAQMAQARERARQTQMRQNQQAMVPKEVQRMPPPSLPNGLPNTATQAANHVTASGGQASNPQVMQAILNTFGQAGLQNYHALQQGASHPFVNYMNSNVPGFLQLGLQHQLQRMQIVQNNIQSVRAQQAQRAAAAATAAGMNGMTPQAVPDASAPFGRHSGSPPDVGAPHLQQHQGHQMPQMSPSHQPASLPYPTMNGMGLSIQPGMQTQRPGASAATNIGAGTAIGGLPSSVNMNNLTPQQRQLFLMQQQMHLRSNDGVMNPQQAYAAAQEKMRLEQQSRMSNHQQQHSPTHSAVSPPNPGSLANHAGMGPAGMPGIARSARSPTDGTPATPRVPQKRPGQPSDPYHMAFYHQAQAQRQASMMRPGTAMGGMTPQQQQQQQHQQQQQQQQHQQHQHQQQQASQYGANGGTVNHGMMYSGAAGLNTHSGPQTWQTPTPQQQQQQQFHSVSPAALQHHLDSGTPRPASSASNNAIVANDPMGDSFDSLFNWNGT